MDEHDFELMELEDQALEVGKLSPREYGKLRGISPQLVYYYLRNKQLEIERCICGRKVIDVKLADKFFETIKQKKQGIEVKHDE